MRFSIWISSVPHRIDRDFFHFTPTLYTREMWAECVCVCLCATGNTWDACHWDKRAWTHRHYRREHQNSIEGFPKSVIRKVSTNSLSALFVWNTGCVRTQRQCHEKIVECVSNEWFYSVNARALVRTRKLDTFLLEMPKKFMKICIWTENQTSKQMFWIGHAPL